MKLKLLTLTSLICSLPLMHFAQACTGITIYTKAGEPVVARTIEWGGSNLNSTYSVVPRGYEQVAMLTDNPNGGMKYKAKYGYVGLGVEKKEFIVEGINEAGLSAGLFYFPNYGSYEKYNKVNNNSSIADLQLVSYLLSNFKTIDEVIEELPKIHVLQLDPRASTVHWRIAEKSGRQIVIEIIEGKLHIYENKIGVLTNSPDFDWQVKNLSNYVNLYSGNASPKLFGQQEVKSFGAGSGLIGLPGDVTPPSRFVRAAFYATNTPAQDTAQKALLVSFQILNNFDLPMSSEFDKDNIPADLPSATQWTSVTDIANKKICYRTMYNSKIRCFDLKKINFANIKYQSEYLDPNHDTPIEEINIK